MSEEKAIYSALEASKLLGCSRGFIHTQIKNYSLPAYMLGNKWFMKKEDILSLRKFNTKKENIDGKREENS